MPIPVTYSFGNRELVGSSEEDWGDVLRRHRVLRTACGIRLVYSRRGGLRNKDSVATRFVDTKVPAVFRPWGVETHRRLQGSVCVVLGAVLIVTGITALTQI
ncbi:MAG TPA: hypothetical protein VEJ87_16745 [Acidimicrobiales bacterium]|nr:hypothetical protein [Acidimicrobiales bacterium]